MRPLTHEEEKTRPVTISGFDVLGSYCRFIISPGDELGGFAYEWLKTAEDHGLGMIHAITFRNELSDRGV